MNVNKIQEAYGLRNNIAEYLSIVRTSKDFKEYENKKAFLKSVCRSSEEYEKAIKCLADIMEI